MQPLKEKPEIWIPEPDVHGNYKYPDGSMIMKSRSSEDSFFPYFIYKNNDNSFSNPFYHPTVESAALALYNSGRGPLICLKPETQVIMTEQIKRGDSRFMDFHKFVTTHADTYEHQAAMDAMRAIRTGDQEDIDQAKISVAVNDARSNFAKMILDYASKIWPRDDKGTAL